jgi:hypothetical protein
MTFGLFDLTARVSAQQSTISAEPFGGTTILPTDPTAILLST